MWQDRREAHLLKRGI